MFISMCIMVMIVCSVISSSILVIATIIIIIVSIICSIISIIISVLGGLHALPRLARRRGDDRARGLYIYIYI